MTPNRAKAPRMRVGQSTTSIYCTDCDRWQRFRHSSGGEWVDIRCDECGDVIGRARRNGL